MSVTTCYVRLDDGSIDVLRADPNWLQTLNRQQLPGAQLLDIDKACDGLVWLLSRLPPQDQAVSGAGFVLNRSPAPLLTGEGGQRERRLDAGYGEGRLLSPQQVAQLAAWLAGVSPEAIRAAYDAKAMARARVYPQIWMQEGQRACDDYLVPHLRKLQDFVSEAAEAGQAVLVFNA